jgi:hypothetical protein
VSRTPSGEACLRAFDCLEVGPVRVERQRLLCPYRVHGGRGGRTALIYHYEEPVFEPGDPATENLAAMIGAQVALNYGLFCERIVFRGPFDRQDRRLLAEMAENTAREIYVNKLLRPNKFLRPEAARLTPRPRTRYCRARIAFPDAPPPPTGAGPADNPDAYAVLSSGGKESLLTLGLLEELGVDAHPIFVNESGRHWHTALNAYRDFRASRPATARVWTSADRVFKWMLGRLPFIRPDHARIRSDDYPIRLWTVAVFLFGALPLLRKRGLGHLLIGCEYDTTRRARHAGIGHHDGLYDQSLPFDRRLTRYFAQKGFGIEQRSLLRPLSELLAQKILVERYPMLQAQQVSCHAASLRGGRAYPCGRCEKCRRIVALLTACGADPRACGYTEPQIRACREALTVSAIHHQAPTDARALVAAIRNGPGAARGNTLLSIRVDPNRAPADLLPVRLRPGLLKIYRQHALRSSGSSTSAGRRAQSNSSSRSRSPR